MAPGTKWLAPYVLQHPACWLGPSERHAAQADVFARIGGIQLLEKHIAMPVRRTPWVFAKVVDAFVKKGEIRPAGEGTHVFLAAILIGRAGLFEGT